MTRLKLHLVDRGDLHKYYEAASGMFVPGSDPPNVGERVTVEVVFQGGPRVLLRGVVLWRRTTGDARARPGAGVGIDAAEQAKVRYLLGYVRGGLIDVRERRRLPVRLRVAYTGHKGRRINFTRDLNEEGAFVRCAEMLDLGASTLLLISPPGGDYRPVEVQATVTRQHAQGGDRGV
ncbi:MAG TPA: PilZ domain-containing protein, partial [Polyangia bacterium]|nr:PilZ domain-containing protein [Polyangia bacterium]